jgi:hypothetical protein
MKRPEICLLIFAILAISSLTACSPGGSTVSQINCSHGGEICIHIDTPDSFSKGTPVQMGTPVTLQIRVTSTKDIPDLHVTLRTDYDVLLDGPQDWENYLLSSFYEPGFAGWDFTIKAGQTLIFKRVLHFPAHEGWFFVVASVANLGRALEGVDKFDVLITKDGGYVLRAGTPIPPYTPNVTLAAYGPGTPFPTLVRATYPWEAATAGPTTTRVPTIAPTPSGFVPRGGTPYPGPSPYP